MKTKLLFVFLLLALSSCVNETIEEYYATGTVKRITQNGTFYGIVGDDGTKYEPDFMSAAFQVDGKKVIIRYREKNDIVSPHNWGQVIELISINEA